jgi:hypothetical protein
MTYTDPYVEDWHDGKHCPYCRHPGVDYMGIVPGVHPGEEYELWACQMCGESWVMEHDEEPKPWAPTLEEVLGR